MKSVDMINDGIEILEGQGEARQSPQLGFIILILESSFKPYNEGLKSLIGVFFNST